MDNKINGFKIETVYFEATKENEKVEIEFKTNGQLNGVKVICSIPENWAFTRVCQFIESFKHVIS